MALKRRRRRRQHGKLPGKNPRTWLTQEQAQLIVEMHDIQQAADEENELLEANNPELFEAYRVLVKIAEGE